MNRTTVKRGIGAVILALIAAALLAFLLKDKAAQRQEVVEIALPGTNGSVETSDQTTRLPTLTTDNSGNAAGSDGNNTLMSTDGTGTSTTNPDGTIIASATAIGASAATATTDAAKSVDFSIKPQNNTDSGEFLNLDLVNNGTSNANTSAQTNAEATANSTPQKTATPKNTDTDQGVVIASTKSTKVKTVQPRLIGEKKPVPVKSSRTATVITKAAPVKNKKPELSPQTTPVNQAQHGYAIQLLATSSVSRANNLKNVMAGEGYPTYVTETLKNGKKLYRVRIGQYKTKPEALTAQAAMKRLYKKNANVNRSAVVAR